MPTIVRAAGPKEKVPVAVGSEHALVYLPWDVAKALGYFDQEGLDVEITYTKGGSEAATALASGSVEYSGNAIDHAIAAAERGKSLVMIADFMNQPGIALLVRPGDRDKYKTFADFKGKTIGVTSIGSATHVLAIWMAHRAGLGKDDIKIIGVGGGSTMIAGAGRQPGRRDLRQRPLRDDPDQEQPRRAVAGPLHRGRHAQGAGLRRATASPAR